MSRIATFWAIPLTTQNLVYGAAMELLKEICEEQYIFGHPCLVMIDMEDASPMNNLDEEAIEALYDWLDERLKAKEIYSYSWSYH